VTSGHGYDAGLVAVPVPGDPAEVHVEQVQGDVLDQPVRCRCGSGPLRVVQRGEQAQQPTALRRQREADVDQGNLADLHSAGYADENIRAA
jgi:hypothetical protein